MSGVVAGMPVVEGDGFGDGLAAVFRVVVAALPLIFGKGAEEEDPAVVEGVEEAERVIWGSGEGVGQFGPELLVVGLNGGPVLCEGEADADVGVHMAIGDMMHELADGPATVAVRRVELGVAETIGGGAEVFRKRGDDSDGGCVVGEVGFGAVEFADGEAGVNGGGRRGCGGCAHTPQGTPGEAERQGGFSCPAKQIQRRSCGSGKSSEGAASAGPLAAVVVGGAVVRVMMMMVVVTRRSKSGGREQHQEAEEGKLLHRY
jgi:hypothetical protein